MIDEKKLIEVLEDYKNNEWNKNLYTSLPSIIDDCIDFIENQPKIGEWILCSERLPEAGQRYLVSAVWQGKDFERGRVYDAVYGSDGIWHTHNYEPVTYEVVAWQPLPEPYKP